MQIVLTQDNIGEMILIWNAGKPPLIGIVQTLGLWGSESVPPSKWTQSPLDAPAACETKNMACEKPLPLIKIDPKCL